MCRSSWKVGALLVLATGCTPSDPPMQVPSGAGIPINVTTPEAALASHERALDERDADAYAALLERPVPGREDTGFRFYPRYYDVNDLPWMDGDSWGYDVETAILRNMTDPNYNGQEAPVASIDMEYVPFRDEAVTDGRLVTVDADITVLISPENGWYTDTRLQFLFVRDGNGHYRIRSIREVPVLLHDPAEETSWARIKSIFL